MDNYHASIGVVIDAKADVSPDLLGHRLRQDDKPWEKFEATATTSRTYQAVRSRNTDLAATPRWPSFCGAPHGERLCRARNVPMNADCQGRQRNGREPFGDEEHSRLSMWI
jgi:hypothetical protein